MHRFTIKELELQSDYEFLSQLVSDSRSRITNYYTPFAVRLRQLANKLEAGKSFTKTEKQR